LKEGRSGARYIGAVPSVDFYRLPGMESPQDYLYLTGNPPEPTQAMVTFALVSGAVLLAVVGLLQWLGGRLFAGRRWLRVAYTGNLVLWFFLCWELLVSLYASGQPYQVYVPDPILFWKRNPDLVRRSLMVDPDKAFQANAMAGMPSSIGAGKRVLYLGDSQLLSTSRKGTPLYPALLERGGAVSLNGGVPGWSTFQALQFLKHAGMEYKPAVVVLTFGYHDSNMSFSPDSSVLTDSPALYALRKAAYSSQLFLLLRGRVIRAQSASYDPTLGRAKYPRVPVEEFRRNLLAIGTLCKAAGVRVVLVTEPVRLQEPAIEARLAPYWDVVREVGPRIGSVVDAQAQLPKGGRALFTNDVHLSEAGHKRMAQVLSKTLQSALAPSPSPHPPRAP